MHHDGGQELECDRRVLGVVLCQPDDAHAAGAELLDQLIALVEHTLLGLELQVLWAGAVAR